MSDDQTATVAFLRAEEAAMRLTDELKRLDEESQRYTSAAATLDSAGARLISLAEAVHTTGAQTSEVVKAIQGVGAPDIIDGLQQVNGSVREALAMLVKQLTAAQATVAEDTQKVSNAIAAMQTANADAQKADSESLTAVRRTLAEASDKQGRQIRMILVISICGAVLAGVAAVMPFFR